MAFFRQQDNTFRQVNSFNSSGFRDSIIGGGIARRHADTIRDQLIQHDREPNTINNYTTQTNKFYQFATTAIGLNMDHNHPHLLFTLRSRSIHKELCTDEILSQFLSFQFEDILLKGNKFFHIIDHVF